MTRVSYSVTIILRASQRGTRERLPLRCNTMTEVPTSSSSQAAGASNPPCRLYIILQEMETPNTWAKRFAFHRQEAGGLRIHLRGCRVTPPAHVQLFKGISTDVRETTSAGLPVWLMRPSLSPGVEFLNGDLTLKNFTWNLCLIWIHVIHHFTPESEVFYS